MVHHKTILSILTTLRVSGTVWQWFANYLENYIRSNGGNPHLVYADCPTRLSAWSSFLQWGWLTCTVSPGNVSPPSRTHRPSKYKEDIKTLVYTGNQGEMKIPWLSEQANFKELQISRNPAKLAGLAINSELYVECVPLNDASHKLQQLGCWWGIWNTESTDWLDIDFVGIEINFNVSLTIWSIKSKYIYSHIHIQEWQMTS